MLAQTIQKNDSFGLLIISLVFRLIFLVSSFKKPKLNNLMVFFLWFRSLKKQQIYIEFMWIENVWF